MIIGNESLKGLFPEFEDCIKENGLDLKIGKVEHTTNRGNKLIGCIDGTKYLPQTYEVEPNSDGVYKFYPHNHYTIRCSRRQWFRRNIKDWSLQCEQFNNNCWIKRSNHTSSNHKKRWHRNNLQWRLQGGQDI